MELVLLRQKALIGKVIQMEKISGRHRLAGFQLLVLIAFVLVPALAGQAPGALKVIQISDTHICNLEGYHAQFAESRQHYGSGAAPLRNFLETVPRNLGADAVVITGDLVDYYDAETSDGQMLAAQIEQFYPLYDSSPVPVLLALGNHDIASYWIREADGSKEETQVKAVKARAAWIRNYSCFQQGTYYSRDYRVAGKRFRFLFLDNGYSLKSEGAILDKTQLDWLNYQVSEAGDDPVILFSHKYLPVGDKNGDGVAFGKADTSWPDEASCRNGLLKTLNERHNIVAMFVGHGHKNVIEVIEFPSGHQVVQSETGAFARDPAIGDCWSLMRKRLLSRSREIPRPNLEFRCRRIRK